MKFIASTALWQGSFRCFACPCEVLVDTVDQGTAERVLAAVEAEALRIEHKFSRYRDDNLVHTINHADGQVVEVDEETARLLDFADQCYSISEGLFDITSGLLRQAWRFNEESSVPSPETLASIIGNIGWDRVVWKSPHFCLGKGMQIDFGGFGKEYAVDRCLGRARAVCQAPILLNFGGDLAVTGPQSSGQPWRLAVENPPELKITPRYLDIYAGAVASSGDSYRCIVQDGVRYGHILNPRTGYPLARAPNSVTVWAANATQAGLLSTLAMLQGHAAEDFLEREITDLPQTGPAAMVAGDDMSGLKNTTNVPVLSSHYWFVWRDHRLCERFTQ